MQSAEEERKIWDEKSEQNAEYEMWNGDPKDYAQETKTCADILIKPVKRFMHTEIVVLDLGCGIGRITNRLAKIYKKPHFIGIDISQKMLDKAEEKAPRYIEYLVNDGRTLAPIDDERIDFAYSMVMLQHVPREAQYGYLKEIYRVLKRGGVFRFQYVEGDNEGQLSHHIPWEIMHSWLFNIGFYIEDIERNIMHEEWTWLTLSKGRK